MKSNSEQVSYISFLDYPISKEGIAPRAKLDEKIKKLNRH